MNDAPDRVSGWHTFVEVLCAKWGFSLTDTEKNEIVPVSQFRRILAEDRIWRIVSDENGWPPIWPPQMNSAPVQARDGQSAEPILHDAGR